MPQTSRWDLIENFFSGGETNRIRRIFDLMEIAEEELERVFPAKKGEPKGIFLAVQPHEEFEFKDVYVYRMHVRELCERAKRGDDLNVATNAEMLMAILRASQTAPLNTEGMVLAEHLFRSVYGADSKAAKQVFGNAPMTREMYEGQLQEALHDARRKVRVQRVTKKG